MKKGTVILFVAASFLSAGIALAGKPAPRSPITVVTLDFGATQPAINDKGEIVYARGGVDYTRVYSTKRGLIAEKVDPNNLGISNSGEVVYDDASGSAGQGNYVTSTVRGRITPNQSVGASISATTGEIEYLDLNAYPTTTLQGRVDTFDHTLYYVGVGDVNDYGEVVFEVRDMSQPGYRIYSIHRGYLTPQDANALAVEPAINNKGEVVYSGYDENGAQQIFSTVRGQLTFSGSPQYVETAHLPDIDSKGNVVFQGRVNGVNGIYLYKVTGKP